jgi:Rrf2 family nitric oxide-sensitive transcriptional repressor
MEDDRTTIQHITDSFDISKSHTMKIVNKLVNKGWVSGSRGKNGGIALAVEAQKIRLDAVISLMEQTLEPVNCETPVCVLVKACKLKGILWQAQSAYLEHLSQYTLADLLDKKTMDVIRIIQ